MGGRDDQVGEERGAEVDEVGGSELVEVGMVGGGDAGVEVGGEVVGIAGIAGVEG